MAVQAQLYYDNIGFSLSGSFDLIDNGCGVGAGFNQYGSSVQQLSNVQQLQFQDLQNQQHGNQNLGSMMLSQNMGFHVEKQRIEIDRFVKSQNERLGLLLQEQRQQQFAVLAKKMESRVFVLLNQKDQEIAKATNRTTELQNLLGRLEMESQAWQRVAHENEAMVFSLNNRLQQLREEQASCWYNNGVDDAESCCDCEDDHNNNNKEESTDERERTMVCKCCYHRNSCVLFLPCRHLCSCKDCSVFLDSCPVCRTAKNGSIEALVS